MTGRYESFARWFRVQLAERDWKRVEFVRQSELLGENVTQTTVGKWAKGITQPTRENCALIAQLFELPTGEVMGIAGHVALEDPVLPGLSRRLARLPVEVRAVLVERIETFANVLLVGHEGAVSGSMIRDGGVVSYVPARHWLIELVLHLGDDDVHRLLEQLE